MLFNPEYIVKDSKEESNKFSTTGGGWVAGQQSATQSLSLMGLGGRGGLGEICLIVA